MMDLNQKNFDENIKEGTWLVQFWSSWCGPCIDVKHLEEFQLTSPGVTVGRINAEENSDLSSRYSISVVPAYLLFKKGQLVKCLAGLQTKESLREILTSD